MARSSARRTKQAAQRQLREQRMMRERVYACDAMRIERAAQRERDDAALPS